MHIGDKVEVNAIVEFEYPFDKNGNTHLHLNMDAIEIVAQPNGSRKYPNNYKCLLRYRQNPWKGVLIGKTKRAVGIYHSGYGGGRWDDYEEASLDVHSWHEVWLIVPITNGDRYIKPRLALEEDLVQSE